MSMLSRLLALGVAVAALVVGSAGAAATLVSPTPGSSMTTTHPVFKWSFPAGESGESISIARSPKINPATGDFTLADLQDSDILELGATSWTNERPMEAGTYYWHVASRSESVKHIFSPTQSFVIKPAVKLRSLKVKTYKLQRTFLITANWNANVRKVAYTGVLYAGSKKLGEKKLLTDNFIIDAPKLDLSTWVIPSTVKKGTRLRFVLKLNASGAKLTKTITLKAP